MFSSPLVLPFSLSEPRSLGHVRSRKEKNKGVCTHTHGLSENVILGVGVKVVVVGISLYRVHYYPSFFPDGLRLIERLFLLVLSPHFIPICLSKELLKGFTIEQGEPWSNKRRKKDA